MKTTFLVFTLVMAFGVACAQEQQPKSPVEEWQISGGNINPYNGWSETTQSEFALHRHHVKHHYRYSRHTRVHKW